MSEKKHLRLFMNKEKIDDIIRQSTDVKQMMSAVLQATLEMLNCDRAWLLYPCDPNTKSWRVPMMCTVPEYKNDKVMEMDIPVMPEDHTIMQSVLENNTPVGFGSNNEKPLPNYMKPEFGIRAQLLMAVYPKTGKPWIFGLHQCSKDRTWNSEERELMHEISYRLGDGLSSLLFLQDLQISEEKFRTLFESSFDAILMLDPKEGYIDCNNAALKMFAIPSKEVFLKLSPAKLSPKFQPDGSLSTASAKEHINKAIRDGVNSFEWLHMGLDGRQFPASVLATKIEISGKTILQGTIRDITEQKLAEEKLKKAKNYIINIINSMPSVLIGVDPKGVITEWNVEAKNTTGISVNKAVGQSISKIKPYLSDEMDLIYSSMQKNEVYRFSKQIVQKNNEIIFKDITVYPLTANGEEGAVIRIDDITKKKKLEEQLNHSRKMETIGQLAGGVAHDFNNMLGGIIGAAEILKHPKRKLNKKNLQLVDMILLASKRAADLTSKLLSFGRKGKISSKLTDIHQILDNIVSILNRTIDKKIIISIIKNAKNSIIVGDTSELESTFINMSINASHAMPNGGQLSIKTQNIILDETYCELSPFEIKKGKYIDIEVKDTGFGIQPQNINKIFDPFYTTKEQGRGNGLGLAAVYGAILDHNGEIKVYSEVGVGTRFHILLPCSNKKLDKKDKKINIIYGSGNILFVDDEEIVRNTTKIMLEDMGYNVNLAENGKKAIDFYRKHHSNIDLIITDMIMPEMNGKEVFFEMKKIDKNCKIIISSGFSKSEYLDELKKSGLSGFIRKPFKDSDLSQLIVDVLKN